MSLFSPNNLFTPTPPSPLRHFLLSPTHFLAQWLYMHQPPLTPPAPDYPPLKLVCISDTHNARPVLPAGDILLHAGDMTINGSVKEVQAQVDWMNSLGYAGTVVIAGNHDVCLSRAEKGKAEINWGKVVYLQNELTRVSVKGRVVNIYGAPQTLRYGNWAFQYEPRDAEVVWEKSIPLGTDVLLTHSPARGHVDANLGCKALLKEIRRVRPRVSVCGHVHHARGVERGEWGGVSEGHDAVGMGEGGVWGLGRMFGAWGLAWVRYVVIGEGRKGEVVWVNAAMREGGSGEEGWVVEI
ncbi:hypothetical protein HBI81_109240 [Parastagonospora nodorum]|nr:hypothetical protein HBI45_121290 [Parastagonospora nodorum]KAH6456759.1 hypothetical protein HBI57_118660 [Parastagonospora nodorum]KAH6469563.1 hypothetical protein HBI58_167500 [Parastagonospora nodorum]KAH6528676.1 hypothetical protein HBI81_109240 [Parastagonospora nodorum]